MIEIPLTDAASRSDSGVDNEMLPQALKGLAAALGAGSGITHRVSPIATPEISCWSDVWASDLLSTVAKAPLGSTITVASKLVAIIQGRRVVDPRLLDSLSSGDGRLLALLRQGMPDADPTDVAVLDHDENVPHGWVLGPKDPNGFAAMLANEVHARTGKWCDVVVTDSGSGVAKGTLLIGTPTYFSTPLGATAGLSFVHAQRCAVVGEILGNLRPRTPFVSIHPDGPRSTNRDNVGQPRYSGYLDSDREALDLPGWASP